jgi:hypothetical protein
MTDKDTKNERHLEYISSDTRTRRTKMKFSSIGPLTQEDSIKLGKHLVNLCKTHFIDIPSNLTTYEYDVLYPEVSNYQVIKVAKIFFLFFFKGSYMGIT